ncbi:MAG TPA: ankyrin repeat domain-containing protein [Blastocatellia bacterium]|nr:ankyrin repeat domain-containing protein [Blastocatellia bacterium]
MRRITTALILISGLALSSCDQVADTPLTRAAAGGDAEIVSSLLREGADPNGEDTSGYTPLMLAARTGHTEIIRPLLHSGAEINLRDHGPNQWTALVHAIHKGQNQAAILLMDNGADVNLTVSGGATALMFAAGYDNTVIVKELLWLGADPYIESSDGVTALSNAVGGAWDLDRPFVPDCQTETVKALLDASPDLKLEDNFRGRSALWFAKKKGCTEIVSMIEKQK